MPPIRPHLSITLPRNFTFHYTDGQPPTTPEPENRPEILQPPEPPRQTYRVRRRRALIPTYASQPDYPQESSDNPVPTIEGPAIYSDDFVGLPEPSPEPIEGFLAPAPTFARLMSPPKTPVGQVGESHSAPHDWDHMDLFRRGESISRPSSACSGISDSSVSSRNSLESFPSFGGSCTSPDSDTADPFVYESSTMKYKPQSSPLGSYQRHNGKRLKLRMTTVWTEEMDNHLWMAYMRYLQDPTVTPFKMLPGTAPPLGVCYRVVRDAKQTWKGSRKTPLSRDQSIPHIGRSGSPDTIKPSKSGSNTPTAMDVPKPCPKWPRSDSATRRRLRQLCKRKPSLSAHYQRLLHCRSPSPFPSSPRSSVEPAGGLSSPFTEHMSSFSTRDMNISLCTSTASTMQYGNPLSQLTSDATPRQEDWFNQPVGRSSAHQKSQSLHLGLGLNNTMGSSFSSMSQLTRTPTGPFNNGSNTVTSSQQPPRLDPPVELHAPNPLPRSFKRRAFHQPPEDGRYRRDSRATQTLLQDLFGAPADSSHRRVRSRGFSLGDMGEGASARRLTSMFTPPSAWHQMVSQAMDEPVPTQEPVPHPTIRLGSPFEGRSSNVHFNNTFPRNFTPHGFEPAASFENRLAESSGDSSCTASKDQMETQN